MREIDFPEFIGQLVRMFELQAANKGLTFRYELTGALPRVVRADRKRLGQILINVLGNAVKFTSEGGVVMRPALPQAPRWSTPAPGGGRASRAVRRY